MKRWWILAAVMIAALLAIAPGQGQAQTVTYAAGADPDSLDPANAESNPSEAVNRMIFENLVKFDPKLNLVPGLAEKWEQAKDGMSWTFFLRKGVKFHDGTPFNAEAAKYFFDRMIGPEKPSRAGLYAPLVDSATVVDEYTVKVNMKAPFAFLLNNIGHSASGIVSPTAHKAMGKDIARKPVGTGPFKFVEWKVGQEVILEANKDYWDKAHMPKVQRVVVRNIKDNSQRLAALKAGEIHGFEGLNPDDVKVVRADPNLQIILRPTNTTGYVAFNYKVKELRDGRVRQAIAHAINKKAIVDALYGGTGMVANQFQAPPLWGYNKELKDYEYNPERAKQLLKDAGFAQGLKDITWDDGKKEPLQFWYMPVSRPYYPNPKEIAEAIAADLAKVGITVQLQTTDWAVYLDKRKNGQLPLYMLGWTGDNGDPDNFVCYFFCSPGASREGFYANQQLTDVLMEAQKLTDQPKRAALYRKAEQMIHDDVARIFIANNQPPLPFSKKVKGYVANPTNSEFFNTVSIEK